MEFPTVSATFQIHLKLFPVNQLLLKGFELNDSSKFIILISYFRSQYLSVFSISLLKYYFGVEWAGNINIIKLYL